MRPARCRLRSGSRFLNLTNETVSAAGNRSNQCGGLRGISDRRAHLSHQVVQTGIGHEGATPEMFEQLAFRDHLRTTIEQQGEQLKRARGKRHRPAMSAELMAKRIELARSEGDTHVSAEN